MALFCGFFSRFQFEGIKLSLNHYFNICEKGSRFGCLTFFKLFALLPSRELLQEIIDTMSGEMHQFYALTCFCHFWLTSRKLISRSETWHRWIQEVNWLKMKSENHYNNGNPTNVETDANWMWFSRVWYFSFANWEMKSARLRLNLILRFSLSESHFCSRQQQLPGADSRQREKWESSKKIVSSLSTRIRVYHRDLQINPPYFISLKTVFFQWY